MGTNQTKYTKEQKLSKKSYYALLSEYQKYRLDDNSSNLFNQYFSLFEKNFEINYVNMKIPRPERIYSWKSYLLLKLRYFSVEKAYLWANSLYDVILNEKFNDIIKFQNLFFYQEYQILSNPKLKIENEFYPEDFGYNSNIKESYINDSALDNPNDPFFNTKNKINNNLMASFVSANSEGSFNSSKKLDPNVEYKYNKNKIKEYMEIFKQHLRLKEHPISIVIKDFIDQFVPYINEVIDYYNKNMKTNEISCKEKAEDIIKQLQDFISLLQVIIKLFYSKTLSYMYFKDEKDEFLNLSSFLIFNHDKIYKKFFEIFDLMNKEKQTLFEEKIKTFGNIEPEEFGIKDKFCLNQKTKDFMEELKKEKKKEKKIDKDIDRDKSSFNNNKLTININGEEKSLVEEEDINFIPLTDKDKDKIPSKSSINDVDNDYNESNTITTDNIRVTRESGRLNIFTQELLESIDNNEPKGPYHEAISFLKKIKDFKVPLEKLIIVASVSSIITDCVNRFWKSTQNIIKPEMLNIDADELMTIFIYIIYKCNLPSLFVHADFINYFISKTTKSAMIGYYYITLQGCLDFILEIKDKSSFLKE